MASTEDAAVLLQDFVASLDNLPSEVHHILQEIGHKEGRAYDFRGRALGREQGIQKHSRPVSLGGSGLLATNPKEESAIVKIRADFDKSEVSAKEKVALAERGVALLSRHLNRLNAQLEVLTPNVPPLPVLPTFAPVAPPPVPVQFSQQHTSTPSAQPQLHHGYQASAYGINGTSLNSTGSYAAAYGTPLGDKRKPSVPLATPPVQIPLLPAQMHPSHNANPQYSYGSPAGSIGAPLTPGGGIARQSRMNNVYPPPGTPGAPAGTPGAHHQAQFDVAQRQHLAQQAQQQLQLQAQQKMRAAQQQNSAAQAAGAGAGGGARGEQKGSNKRKAQEEEEDAGEGDGDGEDTTPYCVCHRPSFGEMIGCDSEECEVEWFHLSCVGLKSTPEGSWFCADCTEKRKEKSAAPAPAPTPAARKKSRH